MQGWRGFGRSWSVRQITVRANADEWQDAQVDNTVRDNDIRANDTSSDVGRLNKDAGRVGDERERFARSRRSVHAVRDRRAVSDGSVNLAIASSVIYGTRPAAWTTHDVVRENVGDRGLVEHADQAGSIVKGRVDGSKDSQAGGRVESRNDRRSVLLQSADERRQASSRSGGSASRASQRSSTGVKKHG